jgi:cytochrome c551/c552
MFRFKHLAWLAGAVVLSAAQAQQTRPAGLEAIGRTATPAEIKAWDIDVRPDFKGLPTGQGTVRQGEVLWEAQCASCHGSFGESSALFTPIAGGTTAQDQKAGRVAGLMPGANQPQRTTLMKLSTLSTLWDYINRAMPWNAPKSLSANDVYALTAYILNLANAVPANFTLSDSNIRDVQATLPNRNGMTTTHALWPGKEMGGSSQPDVQGSNCMRNCLPDAAAVKSALPDYARNAHGDLAEQMRPWGPIRGVDTTQAAPADFQGQKTGVKTAADQSMRARAAPESIAASTPAAAALQAPPATAAVTPLLQKHACLACHGMDTKLVGPAFRDIAQRYKDRTDAAAYLSGKIRAGGQGAWGAMPMPAQALSGDEAALLAQWLARGMPQ